MDSQPTRLAYDISEVCVLARCSRAYVYQAINHGTLRAVKRGRRTLVLAPDLARWLSSFPAISPKNAA